MAGDWLSIEMDWKIFLLLVILWYFLLRKWEREGKLDDWKASRIFGIVLMLRTKSGKTVLEKISKPRKFWRAYGEISLWTCWGAMFLVAIMLVGTLIAAILLPSPEPPSASELVAIPGLNPMIPLGWGALAFVICLIIHEFGHGIQARAHGMRIRNFGLLMVGPIPLGAFAEPEHSELLESPRRDRQRMFAAGPATNLFAAVILMVLITLYATINHLSPKSKKVTAHTKTADLSLIVITTSLSKTSKISVINVSFPSFTKIKLASFCASYLSWQKIFVLINLSSYSHRCFFLLLLFFLDV